MLANFQLKYSSLLAVLFYQDQFKKTKKLGMIVSLDNTLTDIGMGQFTTRNRLQQLDLHHLCQDLFC